MTSQLTAEQIKQRLENLFAEDEPTPKRIAYREAAAVLSYFRLDRIQPVGQARDAESAAEFSGDCELARDEQGAEVWMLETALRRDTLRRLRNQNRISEARSANQNSGPLQEMLDSALANRLELATDLPSLRTMLTVCDWLEGVAPVPAAAEVRAQIQRLQLLDPFGELVGDHFGGRVEELRDMSDYVGFFRASGVAEALSRGFEFIFSIHDRPPLFVHGPGGIGKSTLIAKFILNHATKPEESERFPFVYLDFDRAALTAQEPITLLSEAIRQIGLEYPRLTSQSQGLLKEWRERIAKQDAIRQGGTAGALFRLQNREFYLSSFADFVNGLKLEDQPLLLVLDTFEEVQYRASSYVSEVFRMLDDLQKRVPRTRAVLSGRDLPKPFIDNKPVKLRPLPLGEFDYDAAVAFLRNKGVPSVEIASRIVDQVGKAPLVLRVAAELWKREGGGDRIEGLETGFWARLRGKSIETQLYTRILSHIHVDDVRKLAHPGLVLRKINPALIQEVLAGPCDVPVPDIARARELLEALRAEFTLVTSDPSDPETVIHRPDVRTLMLNALREDQPDRVLLIHRNAAAYYSRQKGPEAWAEQMYHEFSMGIDRDRMARIDLAGLDRQLPMSAIRELPPESQAYLAARLPIEVEEKVWDKANPADWVMYVMRRTREALKVGDSPLAMRLAERSPFQPNPLLRLRNLLAASDKEGRLRPPDVIRLLEVLETSFSRDELQDLLARRVGQYPKEFANTLEMLLTANTEGWIVKLVAAALDARPRNPALYAIAQNLGLTALSNRTMVEAQQSIRAEKGSYLDINLWRERLGDIERRVCRVEWHKNVMSTGFLIGPGVVLIPSHILRDNLEAGAYPEGLEFRFDYRLSREGAPEASIFHPATEWLIDWDKDLDYGIVRLAGDIADRGWLQPIAVGIEPGSALILLHHVRGEPLKLTFETNAVVGMDTAMQRLVYRVSTEAGSSGAPVLNEKLELVAMHLATSEDKCYGVPIAAILDLLAKRGVQIPGKEPRPGGRGRVSQG